MAVDKVSSLFDLQAIEKEFNDILDKTAGKLKGFPKIKVGLEGAASVKEFSLAQAKMAEEMRAVESLAKQRFATDAKLITLQTDYAKATAANRAEMQKQNAELKTQAQLQAASTGSISKAQAAVKALRQEQGNLNLFTKEGQERNKQLISQIDKYNNFIKKNSDALAQQKINVGNYSGAISTLKKSFDEVSAKMDKMNKTGQQNSIVYKQLEKEYQLLNQLLNTQSAGFANATAEIRANQKALLDLENAGLQGTAAFEELSKKTGVLKDQIADLRQRTKVLGSDTFVFDGMIQAATGLAGIYGAVQGATALFGKENEDLQKTLVKLAAVMSVIQGLQAVATAVQKESAAMLLITSIRTKAVALAQSLYAAATVAATAATKALSFAMKATGIGLILTLIAAAAAAMSNLGKSTKFVSNEVDDFAARLDKLDESLDKVTKTIDRQAESHKALNRIRFTGKDLDAADFSSDKNAILSKRAEIVNLIAQAEKERKKQIDLRAKAEKLAAQSTDKSAFDKSFQTLATNIGVADKKIADLNARLVDEGGKLTALSLKQRGDAYQEHQKDLADKAKDAAEKEKELARKTAEEIARIREANFKAEFQIEKDNAEERARLAEKDVQNEELPLQKRLNALLDFNNEKQSILIAQKDFDLANTKLTEKEREAIVNKFGIDSTKQLEDLEDRRLQILKTAKAKEVAEFRKAIEEMQKVLEEQEAGLNNQLSGKRNAQLLQAARDFNAGRIRTEEEYQATKKGINDNFDKLEFDAQVRHQTRLLLLKKAAGLDVQAELTALAALKKGFDEKEIANEEALATRIQEIRKESAEQLKELQRDLFENAEETFISFLDAGVEREEASLARRKELIDRDTANRINQINLLGLTEVERTRQIAIAQKNALAETERIEKRKAELAQKRKTLEKVAAVAEILSGTYKSVFDLQAKAAAARAQAAVLASNPVTAAYAAVATAMSVQILANIPFILASSAFNLARVAAFKEGTLSAPRGKALVSEEGSELMVNPQGQMFLTPSTPSLIDLAGGEKIYPHDVTKDILKTLNLGHLIANNISKTQNISNGVTKDDIRMLIKVTRDNKVKIGIHNAHDIKSTAFYINQIKN